MVSAMASTRSRTNASKSADIKQYFSPKRALTVEGAPDNKLDKGSQQSVNDHLTESGNSAATNIAKKTATAPLKASSEISSQKSTGSSSQKRAADSTPTAEVSSGSGSTPRPAQRRRTSSQHYNNNSSSKGYEPPSTYAHLPPLPDTLTPGLICALVGLNPGIQTATKGHPYAHPSNLYWRLLHSSGLTPDRRLAPAEYTLLPEHYSLGNTNIVGRATRDGAGLSKAEMVEGAGVLDAKIRQWRPEAVCLVGKSIWEAVWKWKHGRAIKPAEFHYGFQDARENMGRSGGLGVKMTAAGEADGDGKANGSGSGSAAWAGARVFVATSTSGLAASLSLTQKEEIWAQLGAWVNERREERKRAEGKQGEAEEARVEAVTE